MSEALAVALVGWTAVLVTAGLTLLVAADPGRGLAALTHRPEFLPQVMAVRYAGHALLALGGALLAEPDVMLALMLAFALISIGDTIIYARAGHRVAPHAIAGAASLAAIALLLTAQR